MKNNRLIVVLGMHRSGTSATTRGLQAMGVQLGDKLMPAIEGDNAKGFWEDLDLNALNVQILNALGSDWDCLAPVQSGNIEVLHKEGYFSRAIELLRQKTDKNPLWGFKDPRLAILLPFWKEVFAQNKYDVSYVIAIRHPLSVVKSLSKRNGFDAEKSYLLWLGHILAILSNSAGEKRVVVDFDQLMKAPSTEVYRIAKHLGLTIDQTELQRYETEFLDESLRHTVYNFNDLVLDEACPPFVRNVYAALLDVAIDKTKLTSVTLQNKIEQWVEEFEFLKPSLTLADKLFAALALRDEQIANLKQVVAERDQSIGNLNQTVAERDKVIAEHVKAVAERDRAIAEQVKTIAERDRLITERDKVIAEHVKAVAERDRAIAEQVKAIAERDAIINGIYASTSWLLTRPLRFIARFIK